MAAFPACVALDLHTVLGLEDREVEENHRNGNQGGKDAPNNLDFLLVFFIEEHLRIILQKCLVPSAWYLASGVANH